MSNDHRYNHNRGDKLLTTTTKTPATQVVMAASIGLMLFGLAACQKSDRQMTTEERLKAVQTKQETQPDFFVQRKSVDYMADLKNLRDTKTPEKAEAPATPATARNDPTKAQPIAPAPAPTPAAPAVTTPAASALAPTTPSTTASSQPRPETQLAAPAAAPPAATPRPAASGDTSVTVVNREQPSFPREAVRSGVENGSVRARLTINATGDVTNVVIVSSRPARIFDREVTSTLQRWKFNPGADGRSFETEINFQR
jgi:TonB family protein